MGNNQWAAKWVAEARQIKTERINKENKAKARKEAVEAETLYAAKVCFNHILVECGFIEKDEIPMVSSDGLFLKYEFSEGCTVTMRMAVQGYRGNHDWYALQYKIDAPTGLSNDYWHTMEVDRKPIIVDGLFYGGSIPVISNKSKPFHRAFVERMMSLFPELCE